MDSVLAGRPPPRELVVTVAGAKGKMARSHNIPFFTRKGCQVLRADIAYSQQRGWDNVSQAPRSDIFNVSVRPFIETWPVAEEVSPHMKAGSLLLLSPSVQVPAGTNPGGIIDSLRDRGVDIGFMHFMFGPAVKSWRGQSVMFGFVEPLLNPAWKDLVVKWLTRERMVVWRGTFSSHDHATKFTQAHPMMLAGLSSAVWQLSDYPLEELFELAGPPAWMSGYGQLASLRQRSLIAELITYHPGTLELIDFYIDYFQRLRERVANGNVVGVEEMIFRPNISPERLGEITRRYEKHVQAEADLRGGAHGFYFRRDLNRLGLLADVLRRYDDRGIDKTTTGAEIVVRKGGAEIFIGPANPEALEAEDARLAIIRELGARPIHPVTPHGQVNETFYRPG